MPISLILVYPNTVIAVRLVFDFYVLLGKKMKFLAVILFVVFIGGCANSQTSAETNDGLICKMEKPTGSNIAKRVCRTPEQMAAIEKQSKKAVHNIQRNSTNTNN